MHSFAWKVCYDWFLVSHALFKIHLLFLQHLIQYMGTFHCHLLLKCHCCLFYLHTCHIFSSLYSSYWYKGLLNLFPLHLSAYTFYQTNKYFFPTVIKCACNCLPFHFVFFSHANWKYELNSWMKRPLMTISEYCWHLRCLGIFIIGPQEIVWSFFSFSNYILLKCYNFLTFFICGKCKHSPINALPFTSWLFYLFNSSALKYKAYTKLSK